MAIRHYLVPRVGNGQTPETAYRAKYFSPMASDSDAALFPRGRSRLHAVPGRTVVLVEADVTEAEHSTIVAQADVVSLDQSLSAAERTAVARVISESATLRSDGSIIEDLKQQIATAQRVHGERRRG